MPVNSKLRQWSTPEGEIVQFIKYAWLDTNATSELLKDESAAGDSLRHRIRNEAWLIAFSPMSDVEIARRPDLYARFEDWVSSRFIGVTKSPDEIFEDEITRFRRGHSSRIEPVSGVVTGRNAFETRKDARQIRREAKRFSEEVTLAAALQHKEVTGPKVSEWKDPLEAAEAELQKLLESRGMVYLSSSDLLKFPSRLSESLAFAHKYLSERNAEENDVIDIMYFYLLPYIDVFVAEANSADIARKIRSSLSLQNLEIYSFRDLTHPPSSHK